MSHSGFLLKKNSFKTPFCSYRLLLQSIPGEMREYPFNLPSPASVGYSTACCAYSGKAAGMVSDSFLQGLPVFYIHVF